MREERIGIIHQLGKGALYLGFERDGKISTNLDRILTGCKGESEASQRTRNVVTAVCYEWWADRSFSGHSLPAQCNRHPEAGNSSSSPFCLQVL